MFITIKEKISLK